MPRDVALSVIQRYADIASAEAIHSYFEKLYKNSGNGLDQKNIVNRFEEGAQNAFLFPFETVAKEFHLIDEQTRTILIPVEKTVAELAKRLRRGERNQRLMREIGRIAFRFMKIIMRRWTPSAHWRFWTMRSPF